MLTQNLCPKADNLKQNLLVATTSRRYWHIRAKKGQQLFLLQKGVAAVCRWLDHAYISACAEFRELFLQRAALKSVSNAHAL